jgi:Zn-dependent M32 family carboxypeptidase
MGYLKVVDLPKDYKNLTKNDIKTIAKIAINANIAYWDAISWAEEFNGIIKKVEDNEIIEKIAIEIKKLKSNPYDSFIDPELYGSETQDISMYFNQLNELLEE